MFVLMYTCSHVGYDLGRTYELEMSAVKCMRGLLHCFLRQVEKVIINPLLILTYCLHYSMTTSALSFSSSLLRLSCSRFTEMRSSHSTHGSTVTLGVLWLTIMHGGTSRSVVWSLCLSVCMYVEYSTIGLFFLYGFFVN